jgi:hypothetical protein
MRIIAWIEQEEIVKKVLKHVGLWDVKQKRPLPKTHSPPEISYFDSHNQSCDDGFCDPDYPFEAYI